MLYKMFGKNLKKIRSVHAMSQQEFAELFDLKRATLGAYEENRSNPKLETVMKIANHFSIGIEDLLTKELTVNRLLKFNELITVVPDSAEKELGEGVPCITAATDTAAFITDFKLNNSTKLPKIYLPNVSGNDMLAYVVDNLDMSGGVSGFLPNDIVIGKRVAATDIPTIENELALVLTNSDFYFRDMSNSNDAVHLTANHPGVASAIIKHNEITGLWRILHIFRYTLPASGNETEQRLAKLESMLSKLPGKQ